MKNFFLLKHPLIQDKMARLRNKEADHVEVRKLVEEITLLMGYEVTKDLALTGAKVRTPLALASVKILSQNLPFIVPILRAGEGMVPGMLKLIPQLKIGHLGIARDEQSLLPIKYLDKPPEDCATRECILLDPMLATGGSACYGIDLLKAQGVKKIKFMCLVACPAGVKKVNASHPDVKIFAAALDPKLLRNGYISPGLGDAGDRLNGTK